jgi:nitroreductase
MDILQAMKERHSVRSYTEKKIEGDVKEHLLTIINECNSKSGLHMQLVLDEPSAFDGFMGHYGKFSGVKNYIAIVGKKGKDLSELSGYYGEKVILEAQMMGLNTCWVGLSYSKVKGAYQIDIGEKLSIIIAIGYGATQGVPHKSKTIEEVSKVSGKMPDWFKNGMEAVLLAPTALNQQKFLFDLKGGKVTAKAGMGFFAKTDLGIVKLHFELGAGRRLSV